MGVRRGSSFRRLKELLCAADVLAHFDPSLPLGVTCDASAVGIGASLFHLYSDGGERPIANISKTLTAKSAQLQPDTKRSVGYHLRLEEILPILTRKKVYFSD